MTEIRKYDRVRVINLKITDRPYDQMCGDNFKEMERFERYRKETPGRLVMFTRSVIGTFSGAGWLAHEGDPNWYFFPTNEREIIYSYRRVTEM